MASGRRHRGGSCRMRFLVRLVPTRPHDGHGPIGGGILLGPDRAQVEFQPAATSRNVGSSVRIRLRSSEQGVLCDALGELLPW